jgi:hypothetical protein
MFDLQRRLEAMIGTRLVDGTAFGYGIVFPDQEFDLASVEFDSELVIDRFQLGRQDGVLRSLNRLAAYWRKKPGGRNRTLTPEDISTYLSVLRPDYDVVPTLQRLADGADQEIAHLTDLQYAALDLHQFNHRVLFEGGAGTGKTMLAVELCRRRNRLGEKVLFTCHSPVIAAYVSAQPGMDGVAVIPVNALEGGATKYDVIVVDEAQDIMNVDQLLKLDSVVDGGLQDGRWYFFLDRNNQLGLVGSYEQDGMDYALSARPAIFPLADNCRNTATIVSEVQRMTGADVGTSTAGRGPKVEFITADGLKTAAKEVGKVLDRLTDEGVPANEVMLLSPRALPDSTFEKLPGKWRQRIDALDWRSWLDRPPSRLGFATIADFKGLESRFVILADIGIEGDAPSAVPELYVGMTRARVGLFVVGY